METKRLIIRSFIESDLSDLYEYLSDSLVVKYEPYKAKSYDEVKTELTYRIQQSEMQAVILKEENKLIGNIYLGKRDFNTYELGYVFNRKYWHRGFAKEACIALIEQLFKNGVHRIYAECDPQNVASWSLLESLGFKREAYLTKNVYFWCDENGNPIWKDTFIYSLLNE